MGALNFIYDLTEIVKRLSSAFNNSGSDIAPYLLVTGTEDAATLPQNISDVVIGVTRNSGRNQGSSTDYGIKNGYRGSIGIEGRFPVTAGSGGWTAGQRLMPETGGTGRAIPWAPSGGSNATIIGIAVTTVSAGQVGPVEFEAKGGFGQG